MYTQNKYKKKKKTSSQFEVLPGTCRALPLSHTMSENLLTPTGTGFFVQEPVTSKDSSLVPIRSFPHTYSHPFPSS